MFCAHFILLDLRYIFPFADMEGNQSTSEIVWPVRPWRKQLYVQSSPENVMTGLLVMRGQSIEKVPISRRICAW